VPEGLFRTFHRENRPLSAYLMQTYGRPLLGRARGLARAEPDGDPDQLVARLLAEPRVEPPALGGMERASVRDRDGLPRPTAAAGTKALTSRHYVAIELTGEPGLLDWWPDEADEGLEPIDPFDGDPWQRPSLEAPYDYDAELARYEFQVAQDRWTVGLRADAGPVALYTFVDLTYEEERAVGRHERDLAAEVVAMRAQIEPIVAAIGAQTTAFYDVVMPPLLQEAVADEQERIRARRAVQENLSWPNGWKQPEPVLDPPQPADPPPSTPPPATEQRPDDLHVAPPQVRLSSASYSDVLRTLRVWADAVERHPDAYTDLVEDRISDLIVATLNAALPGAHREVYSRGGKTDIYIRAEALADGRGPAKVFIGECKKWDGPAVATEGLSQLFGYLEIKDLAAVLVLLVPSKNPANARPAALEVLSPRDDYVGEEDALVEGWPQLRFNHEGRTVRVCLAFVDLPRQ
jgi:hypothetical protein